MLQMFWPSNYFTSHQKQRIESDFVSEMEVVIKTEMSTKTKGFGDQIKSL